MEKASTQLKHQLHEVIGFNRESYVLLQIHYYLV